jgi:SWI/SNF-related matrix-associated actin-dependent regulator of chromatin subfamily A3
MRFLHFTGGFAEQEIFNRLITRPLKNGDAEAAAKLQLLMSGTCLRRRKDMEFGGTRIVQLPSIQEYLHSIGIYPFCPFPAPLKSDPPRFHSVFVFGCGV